MKLPALAIVACFAGGIALGLYTSIARHANSLSVLAAGFVVALLLIFAGILFIKFDKPASAAALSALTWTLLGILAARVADQPRSPQHVVSQIENNAISLETPLRWHGVLRDEPAKLPWGFGYDIALTGVDFEDRLAPLTGGLRISFSPKPDEPPLDVHAGDEVSAVVQAKLPQVFRDPGAFDRRAYLARQHTDIVATLRSAELLQEIAPAPTRIANLLPRVRRRLRDEIDILFAPSPHVAATMRAMLLGDRSFVERTESEAFQKTGVFHILVVAGLHVGAIAFALYWLGRRLRLNVVWTALLTLSLLLAYVAVVEQRPPVLRATLMAAGVIIGSVFFRRLELLNSAAVAAFLLLLAQPLELRDSSFQLSFLAIGCIAGIAAPWLDRTAQPYARALRGWRDITRDASHEPRAAQFRIDLRSAMTWLFARWPRRAVAPAQNLAVSGLASCLRVWELFVLSLVLQIGMLPLMARDFHRITLSGPIVNLLAVPLTGILVPLGFLTLSVGLLFSAAGKLLATLVTWIATVLLHAVQWFADFPRWSYRIPGPPWLLVLLFFALALAFAAVLRLDAPSLLWTRRCVATALFACALLVATFPFAPHFQPAKLEVTVLDVGQGDSLFVVSPAGHTLLIDGGGAFAGFPGHEERTAVDPGEEAVSPYLWSRGFQKLDVVALTHAHQDHFGGLQAVLQNFRVGQLWIGREVSSPALASLEALARNKGIPVEHQLRAMKFAWDGVEGEFLWPQSSVQEIASTAKNDDSLVLRLTFGNERLLLPGDAEKQAEHEMLAGNPPESLHADVLKIAHHGGKNSSLPDFLAAVQPRIAIISAGAGNPYGHPSPEVLDRLANGNVRVLRTDRDGAVQVLTDGKTLHVSCFVSCAETLSAITSVQPQSPNHQQNPQQQQKP